MAQEKRQGVPPAIQYSIFEGGDVFVCPSAVPTLHGPKPESHASVRSADNP